MEKRSDPIHVAVLPELGFGHINPMLELSRRLVPLGFRVSFLLTEARLVLVRKLKLIEQIQLVSIPDPSSGRLMSSPLTELDVAEVLRSLQPPVEFLISDFFIGWSQDMANNMGIPRVAFSTSNAITETMCYYIPELISAGFLPINADLDDERLITFLPGLEPLHRTQLPYSFLEDTPFMHMLGVSLHRMREAFCVIANTVEELEEKTVSARRADLGVSYFPVGPLVPQAFLDIDQKERTEVQSDDPCMEWLNKQAPGSVLYIAFGSQVGIPAEKVERLAEAVKISGETFLWAIRRDFPTDAAADFFEKLELKLGEQGLIVAWAPQLDVLKHPAVGSFMTHCGWNSTVETMCCGLPTICWPCDAEQNVNAKLMVEDWKVGMQIGAGRKQDVGVEKMAEVIKAVMRGDDGVQQRENVKKLRGVIADSGLSKRNLQCFQELMDKNLRENVA